MSLTRIGSIGINTGIAFAGVTTIVTLNTANDALSIGATVNVGSGITLGASGDIFATGVSTVTTLKVGSGVTVSSDGDIFATGVSTVTTLKVGSGVTVSSDGDIFATGVCTATSFSGSGANLTGIDTDLVSDTSPQLGGNLDVNTKNIVFGDSGGASDDRLTFGAGTDLSIYHDGSHSYISEQGTGNLRILTSSVFTVNNAANSENMILATDGGSVDLYHSGTKKFETTTNGAEITGRLDITGGYVSIDDNYAVLMGTDGDAQLYHSGSHQYLLNTTGNIYFMPKAGETGLTIAPDGAVELYYDNSRRLQTFDLGIDLGTSATGNFGIRWGGDNYNYANIWTEYGSGDIFIAGGLKQKGTNGGFFSSYTGNFSRNAIQVDSFGNEGIHFYASAAQNVTKDDAITVPERVRINQYGLTFNGDSAEANALDDYEEGTYTITALNDGGATLTSNRANYTKIGNTVRLSGSFTITATNGTNNNQARFSIPFSSSISSYYVAHGNVVTNTTYSGSVLSATIENSGSFMLFNPSTGMAGQTWSQLGLNSRFDFDVVYRV